MKALDYVVLFGLSLVVAQRSDNNINIYNDNIHDTTTY